METLDGRDTSLLMRDLMFEGLRVKDERLNAIATELFARLGEKTADLLILHARNRKNPRGLRVRALRALRRVGAISGPNMFLDIILLTGDKNSEVREAASLLMGDMRQGTWAQDHAVVPS